MHEIGHYVLPHHQNRLYVCGDSEIGFHARSELEREASEFAADLLFQGNRFTLQANSMPLTAKSVKQLGQTYEASFEATARRLVSKSFRPCMLAAFEQRLSPEALRPGEPASWVVRYSLASPSFATQYFSELRGDVPREIATKVAQPERDIEDSVTEELSITGPKGQSHRIIAEFFYNTFNIFALIRPAVDE